MTTIKGAWILRSTGNVESLPEDPGSDHYLDPQPMNEKSPPEPTEFKNVADAYTRYTVREGDAIIGYCYSQWPLSANDILRVSNAIHSSYGRD